MGPKAAPDFLQHSIKSNFFASPIIEFKSSNSAHNNKRWTIQIAFGHMFIWIIFCASRNPSQDATIWKFILHLSKEFALNFLKIFKIIPKTNPLQLAIVSFFFLRQLNPCQRNTVNDLCPLLPSLPWIIEFGHRQLRMMPPQRYLSLAVLEIVLFGAHRHGPIDHSNDKCRVFQVEGHPKADGIPLPNG